MTKKILSLFIAALAVLCAVAQNAVGNWRYHSSYVGNNVTAVAEANRWVYYLTEGGNLFRLDKDTQENEALSVINDMSDMGISQIYYNSEQDYLVVIYSNSNIDIILSGGTVINMPEIKDAVMTQGKTINDVTFAPGLIYLATNFGYVVIDDSKFVVKESHIYGNPLNTVAQVGEWLLLSNGNYFYYGKANEYHEQLSSFHSTIIHYPNDSISSGIVDSVTVKQNNDDHSREFPLDQFENVNRIRTIGDSTSIALLDSVIGTRYNDEHIRAFPLGQFKNVNRIRPINDSTFFCLTNSTDIVKMKPSTVEGKMVFYGKTILKNKAGQLQATHDGWLLNVPDKKKCYKTDTQGNNPTDMKCGGELCSANPRGDGTMWSAGPNGLHQQNSENYFRPNALSYSKPFWMTYNKEKNLLYVSSASAHAFVKGSAPTYINTFDGIRWKDVTPEGAPTSGSYWIEFMPGDNDTYFLGTWTRGLLKVTNDEIVLRYNTLNSPMKSLKGVLHPVTSIDRNGHLWVVQPYENTEHPVMVLPAAKTRLDQTTAEDWIIPDMGDLISGEGQRSCFLSTKRNSQDIKVFTTGGFNMPIILWKTDEITSINPMKESFSFLLDQDGEQIAWTNIYCFTEDQNGYVWMGSDVGVCYFNPAQAFGGGSFNAVRPKVPRNDGTGYADRLMDGIQVNDVAVDGAGRKWLATNSSGLFLVSSDGTEIIRKFNTTNSPLASNTVYRVCCSPNSNSVFITTPEGLYEYFSDSSPAESSYDSLFAYPNPVRPDYGGDVTITGMMDGTLVKIADVSGNVIRQLKSTGGMATWDLCDENGEQVKSGVYLVLCSQSNGSDKAAVTKIAVIR